MDIGTILDDMRRDEESVDKGGLLLALKQGKRAEEIKAQNPNTWIATLIEKVGKGRATWNQRVAIVRDFGFIYFTDEPIESRYFNTTPTCLNKMTALTKGQDEKV